uniref:sphinganine-1-phosphate aldolase n=1 Tax=Chloropicon primus TaxID=1764295 RepID=A0A7S2X2M3_9CHLO|mmetsp:Transcript_8141/g.23262  ORF Transcript_8141/g.23262 Transcript_8141/m.23262 type:complete len:532 (+) Transcript_8141:277-1872(+)
MGGVLSRVSAVELPEAVTRVLDEGQAKLVEGLSLIDKCLADELPSTVVLKTVGATIAVCWLGRFLSNTWDAMKEEGVLQSAIEVLKSLPGISGIVAREKDKLSRKIKKQVMEERYEHSKVPKFNAIPQKQMSQKQVLQAIDDINSKDETYEDGKSMLSGALYFSSADHANFQTKVYGKFVGTNPIHADSYPSVARMDAELVSMTASMVRGGSEAVCGSVTSGGSESILCAMKASRDWWLARNGLGIVRNVMKALPWRKGTVKPEIIMADSAHAAYIKAASYYGLKMVVIPVGEKTGYRLTASAVRRRITSNTAIVVVSAPSYPHGVCDDIEGIGKLAAAYGIACHVDACLGGFVLPFAEEAGFARPKFDFGMPGLTSMSIDTHKYGLAHKGTSVVLYRCKEIRKHQFTSITDWSGGLYISPTMAGSRSGAVIAAAWASLLAIGREGFISQAKHLLGLAEHLAHRIDSECAHLQLLGQPDSSVVAWGAVDRTQVDIYKVNGTSLSFFLSLALSPRPHLLSFALCLTPSFTPS